MPVNKPRRLGSYAPLSAHYYKDDAIAEAGEKAELLYLRGLAFCADVLSNGFISDVQLTRFVGTGMRDARKRAETLARTLSNDGNPLWQRDEKQGGYWVTAWLKWNRSREDISELNQKDADRKTEPSSIPDGDPPGGGLESERNPNGDGSESDGSPNGLQPRARHTDQLQLNATTEERNSNTTPPDGGEFEDFWVAYPRKVGKAAAEKAWPKACKKLEADRIVKAAVYWAGLWANAKTDIQFIPHPATWLNGRRWDDDPPAPKLQAVSGGYVPYSDPEDPADYYEGF